MGGTLCAIHALHLPVEPRKLPIQMISEASKRKRSEGCVFMTVAHSERRYNIPDRIRMHTAQKTHELGESPSDKVGVSGEPIAGLAMAKAAPGQEAQVGRGDGEGRKPGRAEKK